MMPRARTAVLLALLSMAGAPAAAQRADGAARFNGTWEVREGSMRGGGPEAFGEFKIWALDEHRLRAEFVGLWITKTGIGRTANSGEARGVAIVQRDEATLQSEAVESDCQFKLILHLRGDRLVVTPFGDTCFGFNVTAAGTYHRVSTDRPTFELFGRPKPSDPEAPE
jgi:hypothetical protein